MFCAPPKIPPLKTYKHCMRQKPLLRNIIIHIIHKTALNTTKHSRVAGYKIFKKSPNLVQPPHSLPTTVTSLEPKRSSARSPFYATTTSSPVGCAFWGSDECTYVLCALSFLLSSIRLLAGLLHPTKPYRGFNFPYQHFL